MIGELRARKDKAMQKASKFARPKYAWGSFDPSLANSAAFDQKMQAMQAQHDKLRRRIDALVAARDYDRFQLHNDSRLWWWYFMDTAPPRYYMPSLFDYYQSQPNITVGTDPLDDLDTTGAAAAAFAANDLEQGGYLS
jgi:hypothetical protein